MTHEDEIRRQPDLPGFGPFLELLGRFGARSALGAGPTPLRTSTLAAALLELARRLDGDPGDREAAHLARELRLGLADLRRQAGVDDEEVIDVRAGALGA